jgi:chemotaxis protein MotB
VKSAVRVRRIRDEETDVEGTWAVSYGDMVTLLLTFFILFFSLNPKSGESKGEIDKNYPLSLSLMGSLGKIAVADGKTELRNQNGGTDVDKDFIVKTKATVFKSGQKIVIDFPAVSFFNSGKINLTKTGKNTLRQFVAAYTPYMGNFNLVIQAYADTKKVRASKGLKFSDNLELSALRGVATLRFLQEAGIPIRQMKVAGYGEMDVTRLKLESLPSNKRNPKNLLDLARRVVLVVEPQESAL